MKKERVIGKDKLQTHSNLISHDRREKIRWVFVFFTKSYFIVLLVILISIGCRKEGPVDGGGNDTIPHSKQSYFLYVGGWSGNKIFIVDTDSNVVVDSLEGFMSEIWSFVVTKSGRKMYVSAKAPRNLGASGAIYAVDLKTHTVRTIYNEVASLFVAPDGHVFTINYFGINGVSEVGIIDTVTDQVSYFDTLNIQTKYFGHDYQGVVFDVNRNLLYGINREHKLFAYDYTKNKVTRVYQNVNAFYFLQMMISNNGRYLYVAGGPVFDLERDSVVGGLGGNYLGSLAMSQDGQYLYISDPGRYIMPDPVPTGKIYIYCTKTMNYIDEIDFVPFTPPWIGSATTDRITLIPSDDRFAYVSGWVGILYYIDLKFKNVIKRIDIDAFTVPLAVGEKQ